MSQRKQQRIAATLLNQATHALGELNIPYVLVIQDLPHVLTNTNHRLATALLEDAAQFSATLREKTIEARVEKIVDASEWGGDDGKAKG